MRIWLVGTGQAGTEVLRQLRKNEALEVVVSNAGARSRAVEEGSVRVEETDMVTPVNVNTLARRIRPDLILLDSSADERNLGRVMGGPALTRAILEEIAAESDYPCLIV